MEQPLRKAHEPEGELQIREDALESPEILALLEQHLALMRSVSPPESTHALDLGALKSPAVTVWTLWRGAALLACGALKEISATQGEIKSMHTTAAARGQGLGAKILVHLLAVARRRGYQRISLETGSQEEFALARALYEGHGFSYCAPFGDYREDANSVFMTLSLRP